MDVKRGDVVLLVLKGDYGKPRPALGVQSDRFDALASLTVLPITSTLHDAPLLRARLMGMANNGLRGRLTMVITSTSVRNS